MSTMTTVRSTPNLSIPATQNTAPVYEFRCLYTQDLRKKKKVWHDGSLKYHTFNKRVMVWDEDKNYIGDVHWRETVDLQEGTELSLDRGALVEVGERIGSTVTDLAPLREVVRQHPVSAEMTVTAVASRRNPPPPRPVPHPPSSIDFNVSRSQWQPKSLSAVLGASQGPIGRARLPTKSPFEVRNQNTILPSDDGQRSSKRPRLKTTRDSNALNLNQPMGGVQPQSRRHLELSHNIRASNGRTDLSMNNSNSEASLATPSHGNADHAEVPAVETGLGRCDHITSRTTQKATKSAPKPPKPCRTGPSKAHNPISRPPSVPAEISSKLRPSRTRISKETPTTCLRLKKTVSRRKIMYRDLLPSRATQREATPDMAPKDYYEVVKRKRNLERGRRSSDLSGMFSSESSSPVPNASRHRSTPGNSDSRKSPMREVSQSAAIYIDSSPEVVRSVHSPTPPVSPLPQSADMSINPNHVASNSQSAHEKNPSSKVHKGHKPIQGNDSAHLDTDCCRDNEGEISQVIGSSPGLTTPVRGSPPLTILVQSSPVASKFASLDESLVNQGAATTHVQQNSPVIERTPQPRPFRRVLSADDSPDMMGADENKFMDRIDLQCVRRDPVPLQEREPNVQPHRKSPVKVQRSKSLSEIIEKTAAKTKEDINLPAIQEDQEEDEKGPWTTYEAWDLFAWWPEGRGKPNFTIPEGEMTDQDEMASTAFTPGFISAIDTL